MGGTTATTATSCCRGGDGGGVGWNRVCDSCRAAAAAMYCRADGAYLCKGCDARAHGANLVASRSHERMWLCDASERAPAAFVCKADAASLCVTCDADIHSANPLASRHHRVPVLPIGASGCVYPGEMVVAAPATRCAEDGFDQEDEDEAASWMLLTNPEKTNQNCNNGVMYNGDVDEYLDLMEFNDNQFNGEKHNHQQQYELPKKSYGGDSVVPVQFTDNKDQFQDQKFQLEVMSYDSSKTAYSYNSPISQAVSISSVDIGIVPESTASDLSMYSRTPKGTIDLFSGSPAQFNPLDREARVLRYREKKKTRKFEKTIRYASRKAYAETRPRIKGRFAKRTDVEAEVDQMFSSSLMAENGYGIVPSY